MSKSLSAPNGKGKGRRSTTSHTGSKTTTSTSTIGSSGDHHAQQRGGHNYPGSHGYNSLRHANDFLDIRMEENPAYIAHGHTHSDGEDIYLDANPAYNLPTTEGQTQDDYVPLESNPAYNFPVSAHRDDMSPPLEANPAYGLHHTENNMTQNDDPALQYNPAYIHSTQGPYHFTDRAGGHDGGEAGDSLRDSEDQPINTDVTLEDNPAYVHLTSKDSSLSPPNKQSQMHRFHTDNDMVDPDSIPLQENPSYMPLPLTWMETARDVPS